MLKKRTEKKAFFPGAVTISNGLYQKSVMKRALSRCGQCPNLKGHINEIRTVDKLNAKPANFFSGKRAYLTKSSTALRDDIIQKQSGKVVARYQLKDTPKGIADTVKRVVNHQYKGTNLVGTKETVSAYNKAVSKANNNGKKITQKMTSNGISSGENELLASQALGGSLKPNLKQIGKSAHKAGMTGAILGGGIEAAKGSIDVYKGKKKVAQVAADTTKESMISYASAAAGEVTNATVTIGIANTPAAPFAKTAGTLSGTAVCCLTYKGLHKASDEIQKILASKDQPQVSVHIKQHSFPSKTK